MCWLHLEKSVENNKISLSASKFPIDIRYIIGPFGLFSKGTALLAKTNQFVTPTKRFFTNPSSKAFSRTNSLRETTTTTF